MMVDMDEGDYGKSSWGGILFVVGLVLFLIYSHEYQRLKKTASDLHAERNQLYSRIAELEQQQGRKDEPHP
jgi:hypothetical protein